MYLRQIREKYKHILQVDQVDYPYKQEGVQKQKSEQQQECQRQWIEMARKSKVLSERSPNESNPINWIKQNKKKAFTTNKSTAKLSTQQIVINLKQKLAQSILNCSRKVSELSQFQKLLLRKNDEIKSQQKTLCHLRTIIQQKQDQAVQQKVKHDAVQQMVNERDKSMEELRIENQLLQKHIQHYSKELSSFNQRVRSERKEFGKLQKELCKNELLKSKIQKFRDDAKRLQFLLTDHQVFAPLLLSLQGKHFLGKPLNQTKQLQYWYPQALISGVEVFLKKHQVGHGNKNFSENLVKFIYGLLQRSQKHGEKTCKKKNTSTVKQLERKKNQILNAFQLGSEQTAKHKSSRNSHLCASSLRKTTPLNGNSRFKSRDFSICLQKSLCLQRQTLSSTKNINKKYNKMGKKKSFIIEDLQKSLIINQTHKKHTILQLIDSFFKGLDKIFKLQNKALAQEKTISLCEWLKGSVDQIYEPGKQKNEDVCNQTGKWKTLGDM